MELRTFWVEDVNTSMGLQQVLNEGWRPDPVLMPTGRPNIIEGKGAEYHLIRLPEDRDKAEEELLAYFQSQPSSRFSVIEAKHQVLLKAEVQAAEAILKEANPLMGVPEEINFTVEVPNSEEAQRPYFERGYRVMSDKIYQKTSVMKLLVKPKPPAPPSQENSEGKEPRPDAPKEG